MPDHASWTLDNPGVWFLSEMPGSDHRFMREE